MTYPQITQIPQNPKTKTTSCLPSLRNLRNLRISFVSPFELIQDSIDLSHCSVLLILQAAL